MRRWLPIALVLGLGGCKVPFTDISGIFVVADAAWFAEEETLFLFWEVEAQQGLGPETRIEVRFTTDDGAVDWTPIDAFEQVHTHLPVDCGANIRCGSGSLHIPLEPRNVALRMRYHTEGELALDAFTSFNVIDNGPPNTHRSLLVYGVMTETNDAIQWRARHRFPTVRNEEAQRLGLRRRFLVRDRHTLERVANVETNPYLYGSRCPESDAIPGPELDTEERAIFDPDDLDPSVSAVPAVCATSVVFDPTGPFETTAVARKNPEVRPAFPALRSPIRDATRITYLLSVCERTISGPHLTMQRQRILGAAVEPICIDDWMRDGIEDRLVTRIREDIDRVRADGSDMIVVIGIHHDTPTIRAPIEAAIARIMVDEEQRNTPRMAGAFVFDSYGHTVDDAVVGRTTVWCPALIDRDIEDEEDLLDLGLSSFACAVPDPALPTSLGLGPFDLGVLPILPTRSRYLDFINTFSEDQAGTVKDLIFRVPERPASAQHFEVPPFGSATFFNDEVISADNDDAFSFCENDEYIGFVFRTPLTPDVLPVQVLPAWHSQTKEGTYRLGLVWEFPFLMRIEYEVIASLAVSAFSATLPLGLGFDAEDMLGSQLWMAERFPMEKTLTQCRRFCPHPTFDSAGVYQVRQLFDPDYAETCYAPVYPMRGDSGFPRDP